MARTPRGMRIASETRVIALARDGRDGEALQGEHRREPLPWADSERPVLSATISLSSASMTAAHAGNHPRRSPRARLARIGLRARARDAASQRRRQQCPSALMFFAAVVGCSRTQLYDY